MKGVFYLIVIGVPLALLAYLVKTTFQGTPSFTIPPLLALASPTPTLPPPQSSRDLGKTFRISWFIIKNPDALTLIPNFGKKETSQAVKAEHACRFLANGGFYSKESQPIGLFAIPGTVLTPATTNALFNGFFSVTREGRGVIGPEVPGEDSLFRLQSGPLLRTDGRKTNLKIRDDEPARRVFAATDGAGGVLFGTVYNSDEVYKGPKLGDLPDLIEEFQKQADFRMVSAINLDGGSASAFANEALFLQELTTVGSFFCIQ